MGKNRSEDESDFRMMFGAQRIMRGRLGTISEKYDSGLLESCLGDLSSVVQKKFEELDVDQEIEKFINFTEEQKVQSYSSLPVVGLVSTMLMIIPRKLNMEAVRNMTDGGDDVIKGALIYDMTKGFIDFALRMNFTRSLHGSPDAFPGFQGILNETMVRDETGFETADLLPEVARPATDEPNIDIKAYQLGANLAKDTYKKLYPFFEDRITAE